MPQDGYGYQQQRRTSTDKIPLMMLVIFLAGIIAADYFLKLNLNWVDYAIIGVVFFFAFVGYVKGLIGAVFSLVGYIVAVVCAVFFSEPLAVVFMEKTKIGESVSKALEDAYSGIPAFSSTTIKLPAEIQNNSQFLQENPSLLKFFEENSIFGQLFDNVNPLASGAKAISNAVSTVTDMLVFSILKVIAIIVVFFVVKLIILIIGRLVNTLISQSNFLNTTNKTIGLALGAIIGCLFVFVAVSYVIPFIGSMNIIRIPEEYDQSQVLSWIFSSPPVT